MKPTTLDDYLLLDLKNNHFRYMEQHIKDELIARTPDCHTDSLDERAFWLKTGRISYPTCVGCGNLLSSKNWYPSITKARAAAGEAPKGYRKFCGKTCAMNDAAKHEKTKETTIQRYGVEHTLQAPVVRAKIKRTNLQKYGLEFPYAWGSAHHKAVLQQKYGVDVARKIPGVHQKTLDSIRKNSIAALPGKIKELEKIFEVQLKTDLDSVEIGHRIYDIEFEWTHVCGYIFKSNISERGLRFCPKCSNGTSKAERAIGDWIESQGVKVQRRDTSFGFEIDLYMPDLKIGIEYDGTYWHSARFVSKQKAMEKMEKAARVGVQLITIQEHLWVITPDLVKARLLSVLGLNTREMGRRCSVSEIGMKEANEFLVNSHLQGGARAAKAVGLYLKDELVSVMTFGKPRFARAAADWELVRYAVKPGLSIQGGAGKLLKAFRSQYTGTILSYADRCWSTGNLYKSLGFEFLRNSEASYFWVSGQHIFTRYQTQKAKLAKLLESIGAAFEPALSEDDNMRAARFLKVYDRGNSVWLLR